MNSSGSGRGDRARSSPESTRGTEYAGGASYPSDGWLHTVLENTSDVICVLGADGTFLYVSPAIEKVLGYLPEDLTGLVSFHFVYPDDASFVAESYAGILRKTGVHAPVEFRAQAADGSVRHVQAVPNNQLDNPLLRGVVVTFRNLTDRVRVEEEVRLQARLLDAVGQAVIATNPEGKVIYWNRAAEEIYGWSKEEVMDQTLSEFVISENLRERAAEIRTFLKEGEVWSGEFTLQRKDGTNFPAIVTSTPVHDERGNLVGMIGVSTDITERKRLEEELRRRASHDRLTGLPNRELFTDRLRQALERTRRRRGRKVAVLFMDLDGFKVINDSLGHEMGDLLLVVVAQRLRRCLRPEDTLARFGGDEFVVLLEEVEDPDEAVQVAERITHEHRRPFVLEGRELFASISIGIALGNVRQKTPEDLLRDADTAMYWVKEGGSGYRVFDPAMYERAVRRLDLANDLRRAVEVEELVLHYQPMISLQTGDIVGLEALARWNHPERGLLAPTEFISISEETGMIVPLGRWVLNEACRQAKEWQRLYPSDSPPTMSANLSARQLHDPNIVAEVEDALEGVGLDPRYLMLEIAESVLVEDRADTNDKLRALKDLGVGLTIDDFGTGYSSFSYLKYLPIDRLKIDRTFIGNLGTDRVNSSIVKAAVMLGHAIGIEVAAEGVETIEELVALRTHECDIAQGFHWWEPCPAEETSALLAPDFSPGS